MSAIHRITRGTERRQQRPVGQEHRRLDEVGDRHVVGGQHRTQIGKGLGNLAFPGVRHRAVRRDADLTGNDQPSLLSLNEHAVRIAGRGANG